MFGRDKPMEERQGNTGAEPAATDPAQHHNSRISIIRRLTPHMPHMFTSTPHPENNASPDERSRPQSPSGTRNGGIIRGLSYQKPAVPQLRANVDFPPEVLVTHENKLADFRRLAGIDNSPSYLTSSGYSRYGFKFL